MTYLEKYVNKIMLFNPGRFVSDVYYIYVIQIYKIEKSMLQMLAYKGDDHMYTGSQSA